MHKSDEDDVFSSANNEQRYVFTLFKTENECSPLAFETDLIIRVDIFYKSMGQ